MALDIIMVLLNLIGRSQDVSIPSFSIFFYGSNFDIIEDIRVCPTESALTSQHPDPSHATYTPDPREVSATEKWYYYTKERKKKTKK